MNVLNRQRWFPRAMSAMTAIALGDGILEFCLSGAIHQLTLAAVMFLLIAVVSWLQRRSAHRADAPFIAPQSESA